MIESWQRFVLWLVVLLYGSWPSELRVIFFRRWLISLAFRFRWSQMPRVSALFWRLSRIGSRESLQPALAAYSSKLLMNAMMHGRER